MRLAPAARNAAANSSAVSPMTNTAAARRATSAAKASIGTFFERPPQISTIGGAKLRSAAITASGWVPCESLMKLHAVDVRDRLESMLDADEAAHGTADARRGEAEDQPHRDRTQARC